MPSLNPKATELRDYLFSEADKKLSEAGFNIYPDKKLRGFYDCEMGEGYRGHLQIEQRIRFGSLEFGFHIGTHISEVETIVKELLPVGKLQKKTDPPRTTISINLGYFQFNNNYRMYESTSVSHVDSNLRDAMATIKEFADPFMTSLSSTKLVYQSEYRRGCMINSCSLPVIYCLMKENDKATLLIERQFLNSYYFDEMKVYGKRLMERFGLDRGPKLN